MQELTNGAPPFHIDLRYEQHVAAATFVESMQQYLDLRHMYCKRIRKRCGTMEDAITGSKLSTVSELIRISVYSGDDAKRMGKRVDPRVK